MFFSVGVNWLPLTSGIHVDINRVLVKIVNLRFADDLIDGRNDRSDARADTVEEARGKQSKRFARFLRSDAIRVAGNRGMCARGRTGARETRTAVSTCLARDRNRSQQPWRRTRPTPTSVWVSARSARDDGLAGGMAGGMAGGRQWSTDRQTRTLAQILFLRHLNHGSKGNPTR